MNTHFRLRFRLPISISLRPGAKALLLLVFVASFLTVLANDKANARELAPVDPTGAGAWGVLADPDMITNGSFETGPYPGVFLNLAAGSTAISGWTVTRASIDYIGTYWQHPNGIRSLDLDGSQSFGGIQQAFATTSGQVYNVGFDMAGNPTGAPTIKTMRVTAAGQQQDFTFDITGRSYTNMGWTPKTWSFTANSSSATLEFYSRDTVNGNYGPALDNVSVSQVAPTNTPTPTRTPTPTPTSTPTNTPIVACTPTAACPAITPPAGTAPKEAVSYYIQDMPPPVTMPNFFFDAGVKAGQRAITPTPQDIIVVLDFGKPAILEAGPAVYSGTRLIHSYTFVTHPDIRKASVEFAKGFVKGANGSDARLWLAVGTSNFQLDNTRPLTVGEFRTAGETWAYNVQLITADLQPYAGTIYVEGANDIEFDWSDSAHGIAWVEGYREANSGTGHILYNYGGCDGCYPACGGCTLENNTVLGGENFTWQRTDALYAVKGVGVVRELPQIYFPSPCLTDPPCPPRVLVSSTNQARQWASLSLYSATNVINNRCYGPLNFAGSFTGWRGSLEGTVLTPANGWRNLWAEINSNSCTSQSTLQWITDVQFQEDFQP